MTTCRGNGLGAERLERILKTRNIQGILVPPGLLPDYLGDFNWDQFALVHLGRSNSELPLHCVASDHVANTMLALDKLREKGYRRIGFAGNFWKPMHYGAGFLWGQAELPEKMRLPALLLKEQDGGKNIEKLNLWLKKNRPEAIITDLPNIKTMLEGCPGRGSSPIGLAALTILDCQINAGIYQNPEEIGRVGVLLLMSLIYDNDRGIPAASREVLIKGKWVDGSDLPDIASSQAK